MKKLVLNNYKISFAMEESSDENGQSNVLFEKCFHINKVFMGTLADLCSNAEKALKT